MSAKEYNIQVEIKNCLVSFPVFAETLDEALKKGRERLPKMHFIDRDVEYIDGQEEIVGVY